MRLEEGENRREEMQRLLVPARGAARMEEHRHVELELGLENHMAAVDVTMVRQLRPHDAVFLEIDQRHADVVRGDGPLSAIVDHRSGDYRTDLTRSQGALLEVSIRLGSQKFDSGIEHRNSSEW